MNEKWIVFDLIGVLAEPSWRDMTQRENLTKWKTLRIGTETENNFWDDASAQAYRAALRFRADRFEYLQSLKKLGFKICIATNFTTDWLDALLKKAHASELFDAMVVSARIGAAKPQQEFWREVLRHAPPGSVFIDDQRENCEAASRAGFRSLWAHPGVHLEDEVNKLLHDEGPPPSQA